MFLQEKCQKDLDVLESEHQSKIIEVERLLSTAIKKNEDELQKLRSEMISKLQVQILIIVFILY